MDIGDLAPCDTQRFIQALQSPAQGIQVASLSFTCGLTNKDEANVEIFFIYNLNSSLIRVKYLSKYFMLSFHSS